MGETTRRARLIAPVLALMVAFACAFAFAPAAFAASQDLAAGNVQVQGELRAQANGDGNGVGSDIERAVVNMPVSSFVYTGGEIAPAFTVTLDGKELRGTTDFQDMNADYWYFFENNVDVNTAATPDADKPTLVLATFSNDDPYVFVREVRFDITPANIASAAAKATNEPYTGKAVKPATVVTFNGMTLEMGKDYTVKYSKRKKIGKSSVTIVGQGNYAGTKKVPFKIVKASNKKAKFSNVKDKVFTGNKITPNVKVKYYGKTLKKNRDYTIKYKNNRNVGVATITIKGKGNLKGTYKIKFAITARSLADSKVGKSGIADQLWTSDPITPTPTMRFNGGTLQEGRDFWVDYKNNTQVSSLTSRGYATAKVYGKGNYSGTWSFNYRIVPRPIWDNYVSVWIGGGSNPVPSLYYNGRRLIEDVDYYLGERKETLTMGSIAVYGMNNYSGSRDVTYKIS